MGACISSSMTVEDREAREKTKRLEKELQANALVQSREKKLLLLGAGESGKSTLFKQLNTIYGTGYSEEDKQTYINIVYNNTVAAIKTLIEESDVLAEEDNDSRYVIDPENLDAKRVIVECKLDAEITPELAAAITQIWHDTGLQKAYTQRSRYQLADSAAYFLDKVEELAEDDYLPDEQDILRSRVRTTGIVETSFEIENNVFKMFDVGGQRNERKKWIHCFENVTSVIFVAAISEYDQVLYEDETTNRMIEALDLFDEICNSRWFRETSMILFLNKCDLFKEKIMDVPLTCCFPDYNGPPNDYNFGCKFLQAQFELHNRSPDKDIYTHVTCATDKNNIIHVFTAVKDIIIRQSLRDGGLLG